MPENKNLKPTKFPMPIRFGEKPTTKFSNNLRRINVVLKYAPSMEDLRHYLVDFATATWEDEPVHHQQLSDFEKDKLIYMAFKRKILPSALETIKLTFLLENVSYQDLTHIIRYRTATFSVECSGDKWWTHKNAVVPTSIENSPEFYERYQDIIKQSKDLYVDMIDSRKISLLDARYILPRGMETYCWMSIALSDVLRMVEQRIDKQIQPDSDNVLAYRIIQALMKQYPLLSMLFDVHKPAMFYVNTARTNRCTNLFAPDKDSDIYEYNIDDYVYKTTRENVNGTDAMKSEINYPFEEILNEVTLDITRTKKELKTKYGEEFFELDC